MHSTDTETGHITGVLHSYINFFFCAFKITLLVLTSENTSSSKFQLLQKLSDTLFKQRDCLKATTYHSWKLSIEMEDVR